MKTINFVIFFSIFFLLYGLINYYIFIRGWQAIPPHSKFRTLYLIIFLFTASSFILGRVIERFWLCTLSKAIVYLGSFWLAAMLYFFLIIFIIDMLRFINYLFPFFHLIFQDILKTKLYTLLGSLALVTIILIIGYFNAVKPRIQRLNLQIPKKSAMSQLNIVAVSDIHLGTIVGRDRFCEIVANINSLQPDIVLLVGDIVDEDLKPVIAQNLGEALKSIRSKFGTIAITGNHEYIGGVDDAMKYLAENQVTVLRDSVIKVNDSVYIIGRDDWSSSQFSDRKRKALDELMKDVDLNYPVILLDHQPFQLQQAVTAKVDLQLSGHTHHGQIWPLNYLTNAIYEVSWGYKKIGDTQFYVSCGVGTWGPPIRLGNKPEIVHLMLTLQQ